MNLVIPMAGHGLRFVKEGCSTPKPLMTSLGRTLLEWSMASLPLDIVRKIIYVCLKQHIDEYPGLKDLLKKVSHEKNYEIIIVPEVTQGQMITVMKAKEFIDNEQDLIIYNIDTYFKSRTLRNILLSAKDNGIDGVLGAFKGTAERWSFAKLDLHGYVERTTEKVPISDIALTGLYHFTRGSEFMRIAQVALEEDLRVKNEFYIAPLYNLLIEKGERFVVDMVDEFWCMGTPEDLKIFERSYKGSVE